MALRRGRRHRRRGGRHRRGRGYWLRTQFLVACLLAIYQSAAQSVSGDASQPIPQEQGIFSESAAGRGLDYVHFNGMSGEYYYSEMMGAGVGLFDYDGDGDLDVYLPQGRMLNPDKSPAEAIFPPSADMLPLRDRLYRNDLEIGPDGSRRLSFVDVTAESGIEARGYGMGVAAGDINNDGWADLYVTNTESNQMILNNGDGTFSDVTAESGTDDRRWSASAAFLDFDRDGWLDLYVVNYVDFTVASHKLCRSLTGAPDYCGPLAYGPQSDRLFRNRGNGTFEDVSGRAGILSERGSGLGVVSADFDSDGWPDIYVANDGMANLMWMNQGNGTFVNRALESGSALNMEGQAEAGMGVVAGDFDADGDEDLFMTHLALETNTLYRNRGGAFFEDLSVSSALGRPSWKYTSFGTAWIDFDNDGWLDLLAVNGAVKVIPELAARNDPYPLHMPNQLFRNSGVGSFQDVSAAAGAAFEVSEVSRGVAVGDVDNDGDTDAVVSNNSGPARLLINEVGQEEHWLGLRLVGAGTRRDMLTSWVGVHRRQSPTLWRRVRTDGSYLSANDPRLLIGLGPYGQVEKIVVRWPSGRHESFHVESDCYTTLEEGTGKAVR